MQEAALQQQVGDPTLDKVESRYRLIAPGFVPPDDCRDLLQFADEHSVIGDGYGGNPHPHSPNETFGGYTFDGRQGDPTLAGHLLALRVANNARLLIKKHFRLPFLWLEYGHLVVREATGDDNADAEEFSHPWHFDNQAKHVRHRTHTAIIYLNDGFDGGLTRFKEADFGPFREVKP